MPPDLQPERERTDGEVKLPRADKNTGEMGCPETGNRRGGVLLRGLTQSQRGKISGEPQGCKTSLWSLSEALSAATFTEGIQITAECVGKMLPDNPFALSHPRQRDAHLACDPLPEGIDLRKKQSSSYESLPKGKEREGLMEAEHCSVGRWRSSPA